MATRTWNGSNATLDTASDWSPVGIPTFGDTAVINNGSVVVQNEAVSGVTFALASSATNSPTLILNNAVLAAGTKVEASVGVQAVSLDIMGSVTNQGIITFTSGGFSGGTINLANPGPAGTLLQNDGTINAKNSSVLIQTGTGTDPSLINNGAIVAWNPSQALQIVSIGATLLGSGTVMLQPGSTVVASGAVSNAQTFQFISATGGGGSALEIGSPLRFDAPIVGFSAGEFLRFDNAPFTGLTYANTSAHAGTLVLWNGATPTAIVNLIGDYSTANFSATSAILGGGQLLTTVATNTALGPQNIGFTDTEVGLSGSDAGTVYTGPVAGLERQFLWAGSDSVALSASSPNVFIKGGAGDDALAVSGGSNVLDGGAGSNFLVGTTTGDDTFFVDGRGGQATWSTIVNFHLGDQATIFGFHAGTSTIPVTASDGAAGFQGVTIHSELNGAGTGVNASMTFTGIDQATMNAHFTFTTGTLNQGTPGAIDYLLIQYNH